MRPIPFLANLSYNQSLLLNSLDLDNIDFKNIEPHPENIKYKIIKHRYFNKCRIFKFKTKSNTSYDLELIQIPVSIYIKLNNNLKLKDIIKTNKRNINIYDIGFTLSERNLINKIKYDEYYKKTNLHEHIKVFSIIAYILGELKNNKEYKIFCIGKNIGTTNKKICLMSYKNLFSKDYDFYEGESPYYKEGAFYFIKK